MQDANGFQISQVTSDLTRVINEYWEKFLFLLPNILFAIIILFVFVWLSSKIYNLAKSRLTSKAHDRITGNYIALVIKYAILIVGFLLILQTLGLTGVAGGLLAGAGISALVLGFAFKDIAGNFLAGLILAFDRPFELGDAVQVGDEIGKVRDLNLRTTHLATFDGKDVFIPNSTILTSNVTNLTINGVIRTDFIVGIDYNNNIGKALRLIEKTVQGVDGVLQRDPPFATVDELGTNTVNIKVFFWTETDDFKKGLLLLKGRVIQEVTEALQANDFGLPANIQELKLYDYQKNIPVQIVDEEPAQ